MPAINRRGNGCLVGGTWAYHDQTPVKHKTIRFIPKRAGVAQGRVFSLQPFDVKTDENGRFSAVLVPGEYTVLFGGDEFAIAVPDKEQATFEEVVL